MSLNTIADLAEDQDFIKRVKVAVVLQKIDTNPEAWVQENILMVAASDGFEAAYSSALAQDYMKSPGKNPAVITDEQIMNAVKAIS